MSTEKLENFDNSSYFFLSKEIESRSILNLKVKVRSEPSEYSMDNMDDYEAWYYNGFVRDSSDGFVYQPSSVYTNSTRPPPLSQSKSSDESMTRSVYAMQRWRRLLIDIVPVSFYGTELSEVRETTFSNRLWDSEFACNLCFLKDELRTAKYFNGTTSHFEKLYTIPDIINVESCKIESPKAVTYEPPSSFCKRNQKGECDSYGPLEF